MISDLAEAGLTQDHMRSCKMKMLACLVSPNETNVQFLTNSNSKLDRAV